MKDPLLTINELRFTHARGTKPAIHIDELSISRGEAVAVLGSSGSGKTTLCLLLSGLAPRSVPGECTGGVRYLGRAIAEMPVDEVAGFLGIVFEDYESQLFSTSVEQELAFGLENLRYPQREMREKVDAALLGLGWTELRRREPATLSGGQKQRLAIESTLIAQPELLILEQPTSNLDPAMQRWLWQRCRRIDDRERTLIIAEQDPEVLLDGAGCPVVDRVIVLDKGEVVADGPATSILTAVDLLEDAGIKPPQLALISRDADLPNPALAVRDVAAQLRPRLEGRLTPGDDLDVSLQPAAVTFENLVVRHPGTQTDVIRDATETIHHKDFVAIVGPNGAGKTTLGKALSGLLPLVAGRVLVGTRPVAELSRRALAQEIGYVYQNPDHQLFAATVEEEIAFGPRNFGLSETDIAERVDQALSVMGLDEVRTQDPFALGAGARQRIAIASVLATKPRILVLDEPTSGLDHRQQVDVMSHLRALNEAGITIVFTTHNMSLVAEYATRVLVIADGGITFNGTPRQLFADQRVLGPAHLLTPMTVQVAQDLGLDAIAPAELLFSITDRTSA